MPRKSIVSLALKEIWPVLALMFALWIAISLLGCGGSQVPRPTVKQTLCIIEVDKEKQRQLDECGENVEGECSTDAIYDKRKAAGQKCFEVTE